MATDSNSILNDIKNMWNLSERCGISKEKALDIFDVMTTIEITDVVVINCIGQLLKTELSFRDYTDSKRVNRFLNWLYDVYSKNAAAECYALRALTKIAKIYPKHEMEIFYLLFNPQSSIYSHIGNDNILEKCDDYVLSVLECIDIGLNNLDNINTSDGETVTFKTLLGFLIRMFYLPNFKAYKAPQISLYSLILINKLIWLYPDGIKLYIPELLGISLGFMFFGNLVKSAIQVCALKMQPSLQYSQNTSNELDAVEIHHNLKNGGTLAKHKRYRGTRTKGYLNEILEPVDKNDAPMGDGVINNLQNRCNFSVKIRIASISLFGEIARCVERHYLFSYWQSIFPYEILENVNNRNDILLVCQTDPNSRCRCVALHVCTELFINSKSLFSQAEYKDRSTAFIPFTQTLGLTILQTYKSLNSIIEKESSLPVLIQALKCLTALVQVTPFAKFECKSIYDFVSEIKKFVSQTNVTLQISAIAVFECLLMEPEMPLGVAETLGLSKECLLSYEKYRENNVSVMKAMGSTNWIPEKEKLNFEPSWLLLKVYDNLTIDCKQDGKGNRKVKASNPLRIKSLQLLSAMSIHFELFLKNDLVKIAIVLENVLNDCQPEIRLCGSKCLETCVHQMSAFLQKDESMNNIDICKRFWRSMLPIIMNQIRKERESPAVKLVLCDAVSNISVLVFESLPRSIRLTLLSFLTGVSSDLTEDVIIRATIVRALSVFVTFPSMRVDLVFIENAAESILRLAKDENIVVRIKILWSMGNISDALLENSMESSKERISDEILLKLIRYATEACNDSDKVRCNAVRTLGNLMRLLSKKHFANNLDRTLISCAINKLIDTMRCSSTSKVKWNSCYAIGNMLQNENIFLCTYMYKDLHWQSALYPILCHVIDSNPNYKVKINASAAITHVTKRRYFGEYYVIIWNTIIRAIEQSHTLHNFYEYNHRDQFQEQLCLLMCHIINLAALDDFAMLSRVLLENLEVVKITWARVIVRMIPGKVAYLLSCSSRLDELLNQDIILTLEQINAIKFLRDSIPSCY